MNQRSHTRRDLLAAAAATPLLATVACQSVPIPASTESNPARARPKAVPRHLIVLVSDDQSRIDMSGSGNPDCHTPNLDRLAQSGARFERGYVVVGVCKPSRSALYTGLYPHNNGAIGFVPVRDDVRTWCELLQPETCATGMIGKLNVKPVSKFRFEKWVAPKKVGDARAGDAVAEALREMIRGFGERRMAIVVNLKDPHRPFREPLVDDDPATPIPHDPAKIHVPAKFADTPETRAELAHYHDFLWRLDRTIGSVLDVLDETGIARDTLLVMTSDNGRPFPFAKTTLYEAGINVPFLVRWPGVIEPGTRSDAFVSLVDLLPTALDMFGVEPQVPLDGHSLLPLLRGEVQGVRERFVGEHTEHLKGLPNPSRSIRDTRFKYIRNYPAAEDFKSNVLEFSMTWNSWMKLAKDDPVLRERMLRFMRRPPQELYDLEHDPDEMHDLAGDPAHATTLARLSAELDEWMRATKDPLSLA
jgi:N-sulfoglucosamine sulfohydrolase